MKVTPLWHSQKNPRNQLKLRGFQQLGDDGGIETCSNRSMSSSISASSRSFKNKTRMRLARVAVFRGLDWPRSGEISDFSSIYHPDFIFGGLSKFLYY